MCAGPVVLTASAYTYSGWQKLGGVEWRCGLQISMERAKGNTASAISLLQKYLDTNQMDKDAWEELADLYLQVVQSHALWTRWHIALCWRYSFKCGRDAWQLSAHTGAWLSLPGHGLVPGVARHVGRVPMV